MNDEKIIELIKDKKLEDAEKEIKILEAKLKNEKINYNKRNLMERIKKLKNVYNEMQKTFNDELSELEIKENNVLKIKKVEDENINRLFIRNKQDCKINVSNLKELHIENCFNVEFSFFECEGSVFIRNSIDCKISFIAQQVRIYNCSKIELCICTLTGVFLEDCCDINIGKLSELSTSKKQINKYDNVFDFTNPLGSENYTIKHD